MNRVRRFYRRLLRLYPAEFRGEFAREMERQFSDEYREAREKGTRHRFLLKSIVDVLATAPGELVRGLQQDLQHALRVYLRTPVGTAIAVGILSLSLALVTAFMSLYVDLAGKRHPAFESGGEIVTITQNFPETRSFAGLSLSLIEGINAEVGSLEGVAGSMLAVRDYQRDLAQRQIATELVTREYFPTLKPRLHIGRGFKREDHEPDAAPVAVVSYAFWRDEFSEDPSLLGSMINIASPQGQGSSAEQAYQVIGVMAEDHSGTFFSDVRVWMPFEQSAAFQFGDGGLGYRDTILMNTLGRLENGNVASAAVQAELRSRYSDLDRAFGLLQGSSFLEVLPGAIVDPNRHRELSAQMRMFLAGTLLLAFFATANVSLFLLSRAPGRWREFGVRQAVGAPLTRLARQLATEAAVLIGVASLVGVLASVWFAALISELSFFEGARWRNVTPLDWRVLGAIIGLMVLITFLVTLAPVAQLKRLSIAASSRQVSARASWGQQLAGTAQIVFVAIISGAGLAFAWYLISLYGAVRGFNPGDSLVIWGQPPAGQTPSTQSLLVERERKRRVVLSYPGVERVGFTTAIPGRLTASMLAQMQVQEATLGSDETVIAYLDAGDADFLDILEMAIVRGVPLGNDDQGEIMINEALARAVWDRTDVVGESISFVNAEFTGRVAGVIADVSYGHPSDSVLPRVLRLVTDLSNREQILVDGELGVTELREAVQRSIDAGDLEFESFQVDRVADLANAELAPDRARTFLAVSAAWLVVVLAAFGFYETQRYLVAAGRREYAVRASLGAGPRALGRLVLKRAILLCGPGLALSSLLVFTAVAWLRNGIVSRDVSPALVTAAILAGMVGLVLAASIGPALRAQRTLPAPLLRED